MGELDGNEWDEHAQKRPGVYFRFSNISQLVFVRTTFLTTFCGEHKYHFYSDAHADCDDHYDQELTTMALFDPVTGIFKQNKMVFY